MNTIGEMFAHVAAANANRMAIVDGRTKFTYSALENRIVARAMQLRELGVRRGDRVALLLPNGVEFVISYFAVAALGAIVVPMNDTYQQNELSYFLDACDVSLLITVDHHADLCREVADQRAAKSTLLFIDREANAGMTQARLSDLHVQIDPYTPAMFQFSSGSTGRPKQIARTHRNLLLELDSLVATLGLTNQDQFLGVAPFSHVNGLMRSMMACMRAGATLYPLAKFERRTVAEVVQQHRISVFIAVPFMFSMLAKTRFRELPDFSSLRLCVSASAPMPVKLNQQFYQRFGHYIRQLYGSTETGTISVNLQSAIAFSLESVGTPIQDVVVDVFTDDRRFAEVGETGEIAVKSPFAITGYVDLEEVNKEVFQGGYFFTGDLGRRDAEGQLFLEGRKKFLINKGGYKINPQEIEDVLESYPSVGEVVVVGVPTSYGDETIKAVVVAEGPCVEQDLIDHCRGKIANFKIPSLVEFRESLPKSPTGKVRRKMLVANE